MKKALDACCGSKMFYFDKNNPNVIYQDIRRETRRLCDGRKVEVNPDCIGDFRKMPYKDQSFSLVIFDPPQLKRVGETSWMRAKYGSLNPDTWHEDLEKGFKECWRVLEPGGTLIFKWSEEQIRLKEIQDIFPCKPLLGDKRGKTHWIIFYKGENNEEDKQKR